MSKSYEPAPVEVGFLGLLTLMFIFLKLWGKIDWSWFWVLSPILIPVGLALIVIIIVLIARYFFK